MSEFKHTCGGGGLFGEPRPVIGAQRPKVIVDGVTVISAFEDDMWIAMEGARCYRARTPELAVQGLRNDLGL